VHLVRCVPGRITEQMATSSNREWKASIVISSEHAGLRPAFKALENEIYRVLAHTDDPKAVREYLRYLVDVSEEYLLPGAPASVRK
jgi:hypothetical protein